MDNYTKAVANYYVCNGRAIDWFIVWINQWHYIKEKKEINSVHGYYRPDSLSVLYFFKDLIQKHYNTFISSLPPTDPPKDPRRTPDEPPFDPRQTLVGRSDVVRTAVGKSWT